MAKNSKSAEHSEDTPSPHAHEAADENRIPGLGEPYHVEGTAHLNDEHDTLPTDVLSPNNVDITNASRFAGLSEWEFGLGTRRAFEDLLRREDFYFNEFANIAALWSELSGSAAALITKRWQRKSFSWEALSSDTQEELRRWSPKAKEYFEDRGRAHWILLARIYHTLDERLFSADATVKWNTSEGVKFHLAQVTDFFRKEYGEPWERHRYSGAYHAWRTLSQVLMDLIGGVVWKPVNAPPDVGPLEVLADIRALAGHLERDMADLVGPVDDDDIAEYKGDWVRLARLAVDTDFNLMRSTWKYWFSWRPLPAGADGEDGRLWGFPMSKLAPPGPVGSSSTKIVGRCMIPWPIDGLGSNWKSDPHDSHQNEAGTAQTVQLVVIPALVADPHHCMDYMCYARPMCVVLDPPGPEQRTQAEIAKDNGNFGPTSTTSKTG